MKNWAVIMLVLLSSCKKDDEIDISAQKGYPKEIADIILTKCAISGCHNDASRDAAAGLSLSTWSKMFEGSSQNAAVVPYRADQSILQFFINTYTDLGPAIEPTMPYNASPLLREEVIRIRDWINTGAPDINGFVKFSDIPNRQKYYVLNGKCKMVAVFDAETNRIMRYINIPHNSTDFAESVKVSPTGKYWYVLLTSGKILRYSAAKDAYLDEIILGSGLWRGLTFSNDKNAMVCNYKGNSSYSGGEVLVLDLEAMQVVTRYKDVKDSLYFPQTTYQVGNSIYVASNLCNFIYKITGSTVTRVKLNPSEPFKFNDNSYRPGAIIYSKSHNEYYIACQASNEVRIFNAETDELEDVVQTGAYPNEMLIANNYLWVSCTEDLNSFVGNKGSIQVINLDTRNIVKIDVGYQPKGMCYSVLHNMVLVANRNADPVGADKPHHYSGCDGNNGYITAINIKTLELVKGFKAEVSVDPYSIDYRDPQ